jgi:hypothetical protein
MADADDQEQGQGRQGALAALIEVTEDEKLAALYADASRSFEAEDYEVIINLAWRYQFDDDRSKFKRGINDLRDHVRPRIQARLELSE